MIEVYAQPMIDEELGGGYQLSFWVLDVFNYDTPFREMLAEMARALGLDAARDLRLPDYYEDEDFVEGSLVVGSHTLDVYFEHARSYLSLSHSHRQVLAEVLEKVLPRIQLRV